MAALSTAAATVCPGGCTFFFCDKCFVLGMAIKATPCATALYTYRVAGYLVGLNFPNSDLDIVYAF
jgi:hypothetical protein